jgi:hypothetical protein
MAYDESETKRSRVVVETPTARREVNRTERSYTPDSGGTSSTTIAVVVILAVGVVVLLLLLIMNRQANDNANLAAQQQTQQPAPQQPVIVQQPAQQQPPVIVQQPAAPASQPPVIVNNPPSSASSGVPNVPDDGSIQAEIDKRLQKDATLSTLDVTATVVNGKVMLMGTVKTDQLKSQVEKLVRGIKGVKNVDNKIIVSAA